MRAIPTYASFWLFGLLNNVLYVVILSAAVDLVGPLVPKSTVLLADIFPSFLIKLISPFFIHWIPHARRVLALVGLSIVGMLLVTFAPLGLKLCGVALASLSAGLGELTFLQLTHFYGEGSLSGWSSGTGGAGLVGSGIFMLLTTILGVSVRTALLTFAVLPLGFLHFFQLPEVHSYEALIPPQVAGDLKGHFQVTLTKMKQLLVPFIIPLSTVYLAEYLINQSVSPTLLFPLDSTPFTRFRDIYVTYGTVYQFGVFISRSSGSFIRIHKLYALPLLQFVNLFLLVLQSLYHYIPSVYIIMFIVFYEGLLGGAAYVNTFMMILETVPEDEREFSLGATSLGDSGGIVVAALLGLWLEPSLCGYQVAHGREWCTLP